MFSAPQLKRDPLGGGAVNMADPLNASWIADSRALRNWFCAYVVLLAIGLYIWITRSATFYLSLGSYILLLSLVPYVVSIVYSYRIQKQLHASGLYRHSAFDIVFGAIVLNPFLLGWYIPASVLWTARRVRRKLQTPPSLPE